MAYTLEMKIKFPPRKGHHWGTMKNEEKTWIKFYSIIIWFLAVVRKFNELCTVSRPVRYLRPNFDPHKWHIHLVCWIKKLYSLTRDNQHCVRNKVCFLMAKSNGTQIIAWKTHGRIVMWVILIGFRQVSFKLFMNFMDPDPIWPRSIGMTLFEQ